MTANCEPAVPGGITAEATKPKVTFPCSMLERMPKWLICVPLILQWIVLALRYRSLTLPSCANPAITSGGLIGEGKLEYFRNMGPLARAATAPHFGIIVGQCRSGEGADTIVSLSHQIAASGLHFPMIAKPDLGMCGYGVRLIADLAELERYCDAFPAGETVVLQQYLPQEGEAGIFYARDPVTNEGRIIGLALRYFPRVTGDGESTVAALIAADPRARRLIASARHECAADRNLIAAPGELVRLATIGSTRVGGLYRDGAAYITQPLNLAIDAIARDMPSFHFGRFDVRFGGLDELGAGRGFSIMEVNGAGSEAIHAWDPDTGLLSGFRIIFAKQRTLFSIADSMRSAGAQPIGVRTLAQLYRRQQRLLGSYPASN